MGEVGEMTSLMARQAARHKGSLARLTNLRSHDEYTYTHAVNVALLTVLQGEALGCDEATLNDLGAAGLLHDLGKLAIPPEILNKCGPLTEAEWAVMRRHPVEGAMMLRKETNVPPIAIVAAFEHHTRIDLAGYPRLDRSPRSHFVGMMVAVADCYDAMRSLRCYQKDLSPEDAYSRMLELRGKVLEPNLVDLFFSVLGVYPPGTFVRLSNDQIALVVEGNRSDIQRPKIRIIRDAGGNDVDEVHHLDLARDYRDRSERAVSITCSIDAASEGISTIRYL
jgi:HD-GYP domain-containing protein (c-di-GMP phosphodiesterase class II)